MQIVKVNFSSLDVDAHEAEALRCQAIARVQVALVPLLAGESSPGIVGHGVQAISKWYTARGWCTVGMVVGRVYNGADQVCVGSLVARDLVVVDDGW
ncbi:hypothetical protein HG530_006906 [Fusarium avenaceum]|nr:hypothetical protein HG530_006906 [Fusarium avenaceum]